MGQKYEMIVHYDSDVNPINIVMSVINNWKTSPRQPLLLFPKSGEGTTVTEKNVNQITDFRGYNDVQFKLKTTRARKLADEVEFFFQNPKLEYSQKLNYCAILFSQEKIEEGNSGYSFEDLIDILAVVCEAESAIRGFLESENIIYSPSPIKEIRDKIAKVRGDGVWPQCIHWITFLPIQILRFVGGKNGLENAGLLVERQLKDGSLIVSTQRRPPRIGTNHEKQLISIMRTLKIL